MVDFELTEEQKMLKNTIREFAQKELKPFARIIDREDRFPYETWPKMAEIGLLGMIIPKEYGGLGYSFLDFVVVMEELAANDVSIANVLGISLIMCALRIYEEGNEFQREKYLPALCSGKSIGALGLTEGSGSDAIGAMKTTAIKKGDKYIINGEKTMVSNGPDCDVCIIYAKTAPEKRQRGVSAFIIELSFPGITKGKKYEKMGCAGMLTCPIGFTDCEVPEENLLGEENKGVGVMVRGLNAERTMAAIGNVGLARAAFESSLDFAKKQIAFEQPIIKFEMIQEKFANMAASIEAGRLLTYKAAWTVDHEVSPSTQNLACSLAKLVTSDMVVQVTNLALDVTAAYGYFKDRDEERYLRDARMIIPGAGSQEIQRIIIAEELEKNYQSP